MCGNGTTIRDRREEATGTQYIHPITRFPSIIMIGGQSIILTTLRFGESTKAKTSGSWIRCAEVSNADVRSASPNGRRKSPSAWDWNQRIARQAGRERPGRRMTNPQRETAGPLFPSPNAKSEPVPLLKTPAGNRWRGGLMRA